MLGPALPKQQKKFDKWKNATAPQPREEVEALLERLFSGRIRRGSGTSHQFHIELPELQGDPSYRYGLRIPVHGNQVKPCYLRNAYQAYRDLVEVTGQELDDDKNSDEGQ